MLRGVLGNALTFFTMVRHILCENDRTSNDPSLSGNGALVSSTSHRVKEKCEVTATGLWAKSIVKRKATPFSGDQVQKQPLMLLLPFWLVHVVLPFPLFCVTFNENRVHEDCLFGILWCLQLLRFHNCSLSNLANCDLVTSMSRNVPWSERVWLCRPNSVVRRPCSGRPATCCLHSPGWTSLVSAVVSTKVPGIYLARSVDARKLWRATRTFTIFTAFSGWRVIRTAHNSEARSQYAEGILHHASRPGLSVVVDALPILQVRDDQRNPEGAREGGLRAPDGRGVEGAGDRWTPDGHYSPNRIIFPDCFFSVRNTMCGDRPGMAWPSSVWVPSTSGRNIKTNPNHVHEWTHCCI